MTARGVFIHVVVPHSAVSPTQDDELLDFFKTFYLRASCTIKRIARSDVNNYLGEIRFSSRLGKKLFEMVLGVLEKYMENNARHG